MILSNEDAARLFVSMKNYLNTTFILILCLAANLNQANGQSENMLQLGIKGGMNYSWLSLDDTEDEKGKVGFHAGVLARINVSEHISLQGEALYSELGTKVTYDNAFFEGEAKLNLQYIDVPVMLLVKLNDNINIHAGPYVSFLLNAKAKNEASISLFDFENEVNEDFFKGSDFGITAGLGLEFQPLIGGIRYSQGLQKIEEEKKINGVNYTFSDAKNSLFQLFIGFVF